ncbi:hypothetical protein XENOCAPTIV_024756 [Xenoophorus captivus]|uniref:Uncharacterized protein n=1 Tax=Xenoophorus captivus TaxID=1517983 RepID=A0ABV0RAA9_9TELE
MSCLKIWDPDPVELLGLLQTLPYAGTYKRNASPKVFWQCRNGTWTFVLHGDVSWELWVDPLSSTRPVPSTDDRCKEDPSFRGSSPEPVSSTSSHHTPIFHHTREADRRARRKDDEGELLTMPMVEVVGPDGSMVMYRPWSPVDVQAAASHLLDPKEQGGKFADELHKPVQNYVPHRQRTQTDFIQEHDAW